MDCQTALELLDCVRPDSDDLQGVEFAELRAHLQICPDCEQEFARRQQFDRAVVATLSDIPEPSGLLSGLRTALTQPEVLLNTGIVASDASALPDHHAVPDSQSHTDANRRTVRPASQTAAAPSRNARRRWLIRLTGVAGLMLAMAFGWQWWNRSERFAVDDLLQKIRFDAVSDAEEFDEQFAAVSPALWNERVRFAETLRGLNLDARPGHDALLVPFQFLPHRDAPITGVLALLPVDRVASPPTATDFSRVEPLYLTQGSTRLVAAVWREQNTVFICLLPGSAAQLERLQHSLRSSPV